MTVLKNLPDEYKYHFKVEKLNILETWATFYADFWSRYKSVTSEFVELSDSDFWKSAYYIYFFGSFYKHNGDAGDEKFVRGVYIYLYETVKFVDGEEYDLVALYNQAFP